MKTDEKIQNDKMSLNVFRDKNNNRWFIACDISRCLGYESTGEMLRSSTITASNITHDITLNKDDKGEIISTSVWILININGVIECINAISENDKKRYELGKNMMDLIGGLM